MNAISLPALERVPETTDERRNRHLATLRRLTELCMAVAEGAAEHALAEQANARALREKAAERAADPDAIPGAPLGYYTFTPVTASGGEVSTSVPQGSASMVLARLTQAIKQTIAMECRIAAGTAERADAAPAEPPAPPPFDWRRDDRRVRLLSAAFKSAASATDAGFMVGLRREATTQAALWTERVRLALEADPEEGLVAEAVAAIEAETGVRLDWRRDLDAMLSPLHPRPP